MKKDIKFNSPFVLDLQPYFNSWLNKFDGSIDLLLKFCKNFFGYDELPYFFESTKYKSIYCEIKYSDLKVGNELYWKRINGNGTYEIVPIKITHKYQNIFFFKSLIDNRKSYYDCGANDFTEENEYHLLPKNMFYPIEVLVPKHVKIYNKIFPKDTKITNV